jgi:hypothetical protein
MRAASSGVGGCGSGRRRVDEEDRVAGHPSPPHALLVGAAHDEVDVPERRRREAIADVRAATLVAFVRPRRPVVDAPALLRAVDAAAAQLCVERAQGLDVDCPGFEPAKERPDVLLQVLRVHLPRALSDVDRFEISVEQLVERRVRRRVALLVDLGQQPP